MGTGAPEIAIRLREALEAQPGGPETITWLHKAMETLRVPGSGHSNVHRYVTGDAERPPPIDWLDGAAQVLGVRTAWLALGEEPLLPPTTADLPVRRLAPAVSRVAGTHGEALMARLVQRLVDAQPLDSAPPTEHQLVVLMAALHSRGMEFLSAVRVVTPLHEVEQFYLAFLTALLAAVPQAGQGRDVTEVQKLLGPFDPDITTPGWDPETRNIKPEEPKEKRTSPKNRRAE